MLTYPWKCTVLHCNHLGNTWKPLVLMTRHFDYCPSASEGDNQSVRSSAPVVSRCFPGGYNVKLYISKGRLAWWLLAFLCCDWRTFYPSKALSQMNDIVSSLNLSMHISPILYSLGIWNFTILGKSTFLYKNYQLVMLKHLNIEQNLLILLTYGLVAIPLPEFIVRPERPRPGHPHQFQRIYCRTDAYKYSFFPFAIKQWNALPTSTACQSTLPLFQGDLSSLSP